MKRLHEDEEQPLMTGKELLLLKKELEQQLQAERKRTETVKKITEKTEMVLFVVGIFLIFVVITVFVTKL